MTYKAVGYELGVTAGRARQMVLQAKREMACPSPRGDFSDLTVRSENCLRGAGFETKAQVLNAVKGGSINPYATGSNHIIGYGKKAHREVCKWVGIDVAETEPIPNEKTITNYIAYLERHGYKVTKPTS